MAIERQRWDAALPARGKRLPRAGLFAEPCVRCGGPVSSQKAALFPFCGVWPICNFQVVYALLDLSGSPVKTLRHLTNSADLRLRLFNLSNQFCRSFVNRGGV